MGNNEFYTQNQDGTTSLDTSRTIPVPDPVDMTEGYADLKPTTGGSRVTINSIYAGKAVPVIVRIQDNTTQVGSVYIYDPSTIPGTSFEVRSTNASDAGTIYWSFKNQL